MYSSMLRYPIILIVVLGIFIVLIYFVLHSKSLRSYSRPIALILFLAIIPAALLFLWSIKLPIQYSYALIKCKQQPYMGVTETFFGPSRYNTAPGSDVYIRQIWNYNFFSDIRFFCTEREAYNAGYRRRNDFGSP